MEKVTEQSIVELQGKHNSAKVFTDNIDEMTIGQVIEMCNQPFAEGSKIRIMPDCHAGKGSVIGTTMTLKDKVVANLVGVDIGCGMNVVKLNVKSLDIDFEQLDAVINEHVPSGMTARQKTHRNAKKIDFDNLLIPFNRDRAEKSIGTLGGGNHFIEINEDAEGYVYLVIHSGSRNIGKTVAEYYQKLAIKRLSENRVAIDAEIEQMKADGRHTEIGEFLKEAKKNRIPVNKELAYVEGKDMDDYIHDLTIAQKYALVNRQTMSEVILEKMGWVAVEQFDTIHNYIDVENMILRKGAISAQKGEVVVIPMNMRDGSLICVGKGNPDWNFSGPHGAGRIMSRSKAKDLISLEAFEDTMKDVWSTSVVQSTLDESPFAYKPMDEIIRNVQESVEILKIIKPLYNFKAK